MSNAKKGLKPKKANESENIVASIGALCKAFVLAKQGNRGAASRYFLTACASGQLDEVMQGIAEGAETFLNSNLGNEVENKEEDSKEESEDTFNEDDLAELESSLNDDEEDDDTEDEIDDEDISLDDTSDDTDADVEDKKLELSSSVLRFASSVQ